MASLVLPALVVLVLLLVLAAVAVVVVVVVVLEQAVGVPLRVGVWGSVSASVQALLRTAVAPRHSATTDPSASRCRAPRSR